MQNRIREIRKERNISQQRLADLADISQTCISAYEKNEYDPSVLTLVSLADILEISVDYLLKRSDVPNPITKDSLSIDETQIVSMYRRMGTNAKGHFKTYAEGLLAK